MKQQIYITLQFELAIRKVDLNEIDCRLEKAKNPLMLKTLKTILRGYDDLIADRLSQRIFTNIELWLKTWVIAPKTTSMLEHIFREIGKRIKRIAWGWSDNAATKLSKMIILKKILQAEMGTILETETEH